MINDHTKDIRKIIEKQTAVSEVKTVNYPVLPPIGSAALRTVAAGKPPSPPLLRIHNAVLSGEDFDRMSLLEARISTPLIKNTSVPLLNLNELPEDEILTMRPPESSLREEPGVSSSIQEVSRFIKSKDSDQFPLKPRQLAGSRITKKITVVDKSFAKIPSVMPDLDGLHNACDVLSENRLSNILEACRLYDREDRGYLNAPTIIKCIGEVIPSVMLFKRELLDYISPNGELINYACLLDLFQKELDLHSSQNFEMILPELLQKPINWKVFGLPLSSSACQEAKERGRAEVMIEIEVLLMRHPELDFDRIKMATTKSEIEQSEMLMILELYGYKQYFEPFIQRLYNSFCTFDNKFHFSAFIGCLSNIKPFKITSTQNEVVGKAPWLSKPLQKLSKPEI